MNSERAGTPATRADCITSPCSRTKPRTSRSVIRPASLTFRPVRRLDGAGIETGMTAINEAVRAPVRPSRVQTVAAFLAIYLIWGSTFLAIRVAIESIPPLMTAGTRHLVAGTLLLAWALWKGERPTRQGLRAGLILGFLFFFVSHGLLHW